MNKLGGNKVSSFLYPALNNEREFFTFRKKITFCVDPNWMDSNWMDPCGYKYI